MLARVRPDFEFVYQKYAVRIRALIIRMGVPQPAAEDLVQDVFREVCRLIPDYRGKEHVYSWMYRLAVIAALMHLKRAGRASPTVE